MTKTLKTPTEILEAAAVDPEARAAARERIQKLEMPEPYPPQEKTEREGIDILVIPDSHATPGVPNHRYEWAGRLAADQGVDCVIELGDWHEMGALSGFDQGKRDFEGRRYWEDIDVGLDARLRFRRELAGHEPRLIACMGNHEYRTARFLESEPRFEGILGMEDFRHEELGWESIPFLESVAVAGITVSHYHVSGVRSQPVGGIHQAANMLSKIMRSAIMGHTHTYDFATRSTPGQRLQGLVAGCWFEHRMEWAGPANDFYHPALTILRSAHDGRYDLEVWSLERVKQVYG
jgi:predicted phosphodiesterase